MIKTSYLDGEERKRAITEAIKIIQSQEITTENEEMGFYRNLIQSIEKKEHRTLWIEWVKKNKDKISTNTINLYLESFTDLENYDIENIQFFNFFIMED